MLSTINSSANNASDRTPERIAALRGQLLGGAGQGGRQAAGRAFPQTLTPVTWRVTFCDVIKTFADKRTKDLYETGKARRFPTDVATRAARKLEYVDLAATLEDLRTPPGNRLHVLKGDRKAQHAISINEQWRICFRFEDGDAYDVEVCDYH